MFCMLMVVGNIKEIAKNVSQMHSRILLILTQERAGLLGHDPIYGISLRSHHQTGQRFKNISENIRIENFLRWLVGFLFSRTLQGRTCT